MGGSASRGCVQAQRIHGLGLPCLQNGARRAARCRGLRIVATPHLGLIGLLCPSETGTVSLHPVGAGTSLNHPGPHGCAMVDPRSTCAMCFWGGSMTGPEGLVGVAPPARSFIPARADRGSKGARNCVSHRFLYVGAPSGDL
eukprot:7376763-Prymnesium_polylepis.1